MRHYCTYFDSNYLLRGLTLFRSLQQHSPDFTLWVLCCDAAAFESIETLDLPNLRAVRLSEVEAFEPRLALAQTNRTRVEYLWTLSPIWPLFLLKTQPQIEMITYLDADLFFYSSPEPIFDEIGANSIAMIAHRFAPRNAHMEQNGIYNVGWLSFRRDTETLKCLQIWREQCLDWCYDAPDSDRYGDQKYLNDWPQRFERVRVIEHEGAGLAPWNWQNYSVKQRDGQLYSNGARLIFFHFHSFRILNSWLYDSVFTGHLYGEIPSSMRRLLFDPYLRCMRETARWARAAGCRVEFGHVTLSKYLALCGERLFLKKLLGRQFFVYRGLK